MGLAALWSISAGVYGGWATLLGVFLEGRQTPVQIVRLLELQNHFKMISVIS